MTDSPTSIPTALFTLFFALVFVSLYIGSMLLASRFYARRRQTGPRHRAIVFAYSVILFIIFLIDLSRHDLAQRRYQPLGYFVFLIGFSLSSIMFGILTRLIGNNLVSAIQVLVVTLYMFFECNIWVSLLLNQFQDTFSNQTQAQNHKHQIFKSLLLIIFEFTLNFGLYLLILQIWNKRAEDPTIQRQILGFETQQTRESYSFMRYGLPFCFILCSIALSFMAVVVEQLQFNLIERAHHHFPDGKQQQIQDTYWFIQTGLSGILLRIIFPIFFSLFDFEHHEDTSCCGRSNRYKNAQFLTVICALGLTGGRYYAQFHQSS